MLKTIKNSIIFLRTALIKKASTFKTFTYLKQNKVIKVLKKTIISYILSKILKNIYVIITIIKKIKTRKTNFKAFLFITYFISYLKTNNYKRKKYV